jgi:hypothetical protein
MGLPQRSKIRHGRFFVVKQQKRTIAMHCKQPVRRRTDSTSFLHVLCLARRCGAKGFFKGIFGAAAGENKK